MTINIIGLYLLTTKKTKVNLSVCCYFKWIWKLTLIFSLIQRDVRSYSLFQSRELSSDSNIVCGIRCFGDFFRSFGLPSKPFLNTKIPYVCDSKQFKIKINWHQNAIFFLQDLPEKMSSSCWNDHTEMRRSFKPISMLMETQTKLLCQHSRQMLFYPRWKHDVLHNFSSRWSHFRICDDIFRRNFFYFAFFFDNKFPNCF